MTELLAPLLNSTASNMENGGEIQWVVPFRAEYGIHSWLTLKRSELYESSCLESGRRRQKWEIGGKSWVLWNLRKTVIRILLKALACVLKLNQNGIMFNNGPENSKYGETMGGQFASYS